MRQGLLVFTDSLQITNDLEVDYNLKSILFNKGDTISLPIQIHNNSIQQYEIHHSVFPGNVIVLLFKNDKMIEVPAICKITDIIKPDESSSSDLKFVVPDENDGRYKFAISFKSWFGPTLNSRVTSVILQ